MVAGFAGLKKAFTASPAHPPHPLRENAFRAEAAVVTLRTQEEAEAPYRSIAKLRMCSGMATPGLSFGSGSGAPIATDIGSTPAQIGSA